MNQEMPVIELDKTHIKKVSRICAAAFLKDPQAVHMIPDPGSRKKTLRHIFEFALSYGMRYGKCYATSPRLEGISVWLSEEGVDVTPLKLMKAGLLPFFYKAGGKLISKLMSFVSYSIEVRKKNISSTHWHLFLLAVNPAHQGRGHAGELLNSMFRRTDEENIMCYLETHNEKNVGIYERYGFKVVHQSPVPDTPVNLWAMAREPRAKNVISPCIAS